MTNRILFEPFSENFSVKLIAHGDELSSINIRYRYDNTGRFDDSFKNYELGQVLTGGPLDRPSSWLGIQFEINGQSKDSSNYFQFVTSGGFIDVQGFLDDPHYSYYTFYNLFADCKNIRMVDHLHFAFIRSIGPSGPEILNLQSLGKFCYANMFKNCTSLINYPIIHADERLDLYDWCFAGMFNGCTSLTAAPVLPPTGLAPYCYDSMFYNCKSLSSVPSGMLPALSLAPYCYASMFNSCTSLTASPYINAYIIFENHDGSLKNMFMDCSNLHEISIRSVNQNSFAGNTTQNWVKGVPTRGTFIGFQGSIQKYHCSPSMVPYGWNRPYDQITVDDIPRIVFDYFDAVDSGTRYLSTCISGYVHSNYLEGSYYTYRVDKLPKGVTLFPRGVFRCDSTLMQNETVSATLIVQKFNSVDTSISYPVTKNIVIRTRNNSLLPLTFKGLAFDEAKVKVNTSFNGTLYYKYNNEEQWTQLTKNSTYTFNVTNTRYVSFQGLSSNHYVDYDFYFDLSETPSGTYCEVYGNINSLYGLYDRKAIWKGYGRFFSNDISNYPSESELWNEPSGCNALRYASGLVLPSGQSQWATYQNLFKNQKALVLPPVLPATTLAPQCYLGMFYGCTSLTAAPDLPAETAAQDCYRSMFEYCTSLVTVPSALCYYNSETGTYASMFRYCTSLTDAPKLRERSLIGAINPTMHEIGSYDRMFSNCTSLTSISVRLTDWTNETTNDWVYNVAPTGVFYKRATLPTRYGDNFIPSGWTVINKQL